MHRSSQLTKRLIAEYVAKFEFDLGGATDMKDIEVCQSRHHVILTKTNYARWPHSHPPSACARSGSIQQTFCECNVIQWDVIEDFITKTYLIPESVILQHLLMSRYISCGQNIEIVTSVSSCMQDRSLRDSDTNLQILKIIKNKLNVSLD